MKFTELDLHPLLQKNIDKINFIECTPIQESAIPNILQSRDIAGLAQTGTGKTAAFLLPLIDRVLRGRDMAAQPGGGSVPEANPDDQNDPEKTTAGAEAAELHLRYFPEWRRRQYILILVPTRELADQVYENCQIFLEGTGLSAISVYGGTTYEKQKNGFRDGVEFVIATPGRLIDLHKENICDLRQVRAIVFDEADRMFDMGFKDDMKFILRRIPRERQFLVFSATLNFDVLNVAYEFGAFPVEINISKDQAKADNVADEILHVGQSDKPKFLLSMLKVRNPKQAIIFSNFKHNVERVARFLSENGVPAVGISSLLTQAQRNRVMAQFKGENERNILVATDLAARGLDILGVDLVVNYELPDDPENYVHRIGRTGRAGHKGHAFSLVSDRDVDALTRIEDFLGHKIAIGWLDDKDMVTEMKPFPQDHDRPRSFDRGPREGGRSGGGRGGPRRDGGRDGGRGHGGGRGPRPGGQGGGGRPHHNRNENRNGEHRKDFKRPHHDRPQNDRNQQQPVDGDNLQLQDVPQDQKQSGLRQPQRERRSLRGGPRGEHRRRNQGQERERSPDWQKRDGEAKRDGPRTADVHRRDRLHTNRGHNNRHRHKDGQPRQAGVYRPGGPRPGAAAAKSASVGAKVTGFFKKLFGAKD